MMLSPLFFLFLNFVSALPEAILAPLAPISSDSFIIPDRYLVLLGPRLKAEGVDDGPMSLEKRMEWDLKEEEHHLWLQNFCENHAPFVAVAGEESRSPKVSQKFNIGDVRGYSGYFPKDVLLEIRAKPEVKMVEMNQIYKIKFPSSKLALNDDSSSSLIDTYLSSFDENMINGAFVDIKNKVSVRKANVAANVKVSNGVRRRRGNGQQNNVKPPADSQKPPADDQKPPADAQNTKVKIITQKNAPWGLSRLNQKENLGSSPFSYKYSSRAGKDVRVYVIDTGINIDHEEFSGRAIFGINTINDILTDQNGHGTHVAGTIAGSTYGVAKKATLIAVKVLDANGSGTTDSVISGINWVITDMKNRKDRAVVNMSLGGGFSAILNSALNEVSRNGIVVAVAAGNNASNACNESPSSASGVLSVAASDINDDFAYFSNFGSCVNIIAPGVNVKSSWIDSTTDTRTISGTSMASPHVAGVLALHLSSPLYKSFTPRELYSLLLKDSVTNTITDVPSNTLNKFLNIVLSNK